MQRFQNYPFICSLLAIIVTWFLVVITNYRVGTWLIGWDSLLPEINIWLNISRSLTAAWQEYQGLGLLGGIGHGSEITRQILLLPFILSLPTSLIRYLWTFAMLLLGPLGVFFWTRQLIKDKLSLSSYFVELSALVASLAYLLNLATIQYFFLPLEAFSSFYGFLPWLLMTAVQYLHTPSSKRLWKFAVWSLLATSAFHVQTLFVVYAIVLGFFMLESWWERGSAQLKPIFTIILVLIGIHSFWLLPVGYFGAFGAQDTLTGKQDMISTPESHLLNKGFGDWFHVFTLQGYWLEYIDSNDGTHTYLLQTWRSYLQNPIIIVLLSVFSGLCFAGLIALCFKRNSKSFSWSFIIAFIFTAGMLTAGTGPLGLIFSVFTQLPLMYQMFRVAFTKWSMVAGLLYCLGIGFLIAFVTSSVQEKFKQLVFHTSLSVCLLLILGITLPVFGGQLFYDNIQIQTPAAYQQLFDFFEQQPTQKRILVLPLHTFWGWHVNNWNYRGSGFIWYGIKQPIVDRNFDVWSRTNEEFYQQLQEAMYQKDVKYFSSLIETHDISYLLVDESELTGSGKSLAATTAEQESFLTTIGAKQVFESDFFRVFEIEHNDSFIDSSDQATELNSDSTVLAGSLFTTTGIPTFSRVVGEQPLIYPFSSFIKHSPENITYTDKTTTLNYTYNLADAEVFLDLTSLDKVSNSGRLATISYNDGTITSKLSSALSILVDNKPIFTSSEISDVDTLFTENYPAKIILDINGSPVELENGEKTSVWINQSNQKYSIGVIDASKVTISDGTFYIDPVNVLTFEIPNQEINQTSIKTSVKSGSIISLELPSVALKMPLQDLLETPTNCDLFGRGGIAHRFEGSAVIFEAFNRGTLCTGISLPGANITTDHLVRIKGENITGRPLKFFFSNTVDNSVLLENLTADSIYDQTILLPGVAVDTQNTYSLNFQTQSLGGEQVANLLSEVLVYELPFPSQALAGINIRKVDHTVDSFTLLDEITVKKLGTHQYTIETVATGGQNLLLLSQSYHAGWIAFPGAQFWKQYEHVTYNGWKNGWIITGTEAGQQLSITIFFWPQLLSFIGYGLLVLTFTTLIGMTVKEKYFTHTSTEELITRLFHLKRRVGKKARNGLIGKKHIH